MNRYHSARAEKEATGEAPFKKQTSLAERAKYQFEADNEDEEIDSELEIPLEALRAPEKRLGTLAKTMGEEVGTQGQLLAQTTSKVIRFRFFQRELH